MTEQTTTTAPVDKQELAALFSDPIANDTAIKVTLWDVAGCVAKKIRGMDREDAQSIAYEQMLLVLPKYTPDSDPFGYFYQAGRWKCWDKVRADKGRRVAAIAMVPPEKIRSNRCIGAVAAGGMRSMGGHSRVKPRDALAATDVAICRMRKAITGVERRERFDTDDPDYRRLAFGLDLLQSLRFEMVGRYRPMRTPTVTYKRDRMIPKT